MRTFTILCLLFLSLQLQAIELNKETHKLDGKDITYQYTSGRSYHVKFEPEGISYQYLSGSSPTSWWGPFSYTAFEVSKNIFMASWYEEGYGDHVTLLIDFNKKILYGSALIITKDKNIIHFHGAKMIK